MIEAAKSITLNPGYSVRPFEAMSIALEEKDFFHPADDYARAHYSHVCKLDARVDMKGRATSLAIRFAKTLPDLEQ